MNSLLREVVFCLLFLYLAVSSFIAEFFGGFLHSFLCLFGWASIQESDAEEVGFAPFYYSYVILLSLLGNFVFVLSFIIYGPIWMRSRTQFAEKRQTNEGLVEVVSPPNQTIFCLNRRMPYICVFTRYDMYASIVLAFIFVQILCQQFAGIDDFKDVERILFKKTVDKFKANSSAEMNCWDEWCEEVSGRQAFKQILELQKSMQCCGWDEPKDWLTINGHNCRLKTHSLPKSCCSPSTRVCSLESKYLFTEEVVSNTDYPFETVSTRPVIPTTVSVFIQFSNC